MKRLVCGILALCLLLGCLPALADAHPTNWYEVFVYSFNDSDGDGIGDFKGLLGKLDYIQDMGYTASRLMPIMPSPSYHKYDVTDYLDVDPVYGTLDDFRAVVAGCHERGIGRSSTWWSTIPPPAIPGFWRLWRHSKRPARSPQGGLLQLHPGIGQQFRQTARHRLVL